MENTFFYDIKNPLIKEESKESTSIFIKNTKIIEITFVKEEVLTLCLNFSDEFKIISPDILELNKSYFFDYSLLPLNKSGIIPFKNLILKFENFYITISIDFINDIRIKKDNNNIFIITKNLNDFLLNIAYFTDLEEFYKKPDPDYNNNSLSGVGVILDFKEYENENVSFSDIKSILSQDEIYLLIKNWEDKNGILNPKTKYIEDFDSFLEKLKINNIKSIFHFTNTIPIDESRNYDCFKLRNGDYFLSKNRLVIDYFSNNGKEKLISDINEKLNKESTGIYLQPLDFLDNNKNFYDKIIVKHENIFLPLKENIKKGLQIIDEIGNTFNNNGYLTFSNSCYSTNFSSNIILIEININYEKMYSIIEQYFLQGYSNIGFILNPDSLNKISTRNLLKLFLISFFSKIFFVDISVVLNFFISFKTKDEIIKIFKLRFEYFIFIRLLYEDFQKNGIIPLINCKIEEKIKGFFLGKTVYFGFTNNFLFEQFVYLPEGNWYCINSSKIISGNGNFSYREKKDDFLMFQKENSVIPSNPESIYSEKKFLKTIKFNIFVINDFIFNFNEYSQDNNELINHKFIIKFRKDKILLKYSSKNEENLNRKIIFHFVCNPDIIKNVFFDNKKILNKKIKRDSIEFDIKNTINQIDLELIYFEKQK